MVSRFLTELPIKPLPEGPDRFLIEDIPGVGTKTTTFSALKEYLGITQPGGLNNLGTETGNVNIGNVSGTVGLTGTQISIYATQFFRVNPVTSRTTDINTGTGGTTTTIGHNSNNNALILNSRSITAPNQTITGDSSLMTRVAGDARYGQLLDIVREVPSSTIDTSTYVDIALIDEDLATNTLYEVDSMVFIDRQNVDVETITTNVRLAYGSSVSLAALQTRSFMGGVSNEIYTSGPSLISPLGSLSTDISTLQYFTIKGVIKTSGVGKLSVQISADNATSGYIQALPGTYLKLRKL